MPMVSLLCRIASLTDEWTDEIWKNISEQYDTSEKVIKDEWSSEGVWTSGVDIPVLRNILTYLIERVNRGGYHYENEIKGSELAKIIGQPLEKVLPCLWFLDGITIIDFEELRNGSIAMFNIGFTELLDFTSTEDGDGIAFISPGLVGLREDEAKRFVDSAVEFLKGERLKETLRKRGFN